MLPLLIWLGGYFWLNSSTGRAMLTSAIQGQIKSERVTFEDVRYGPAPDVFQLLGLRVVDASQTPLVTAQRVQANIDLGALIGGKYSVDAVHAHAFELLLAWDDDGKLTLATAFAKPKDPDAPPPTIPKPESKPPTFALPEVQLSHGDLRLEGPRWGLRFAAVNASGQISSNPTDGLSIAADLTSGTADARLGKKPAVIAFDQVMIEAFQWAGQGFEVSRLRLIQPDGAGVDLTGGMGFGDHLTATAKGRATIDAATAETLFPGAIPEGARLDGIDLTVAGSTISGAIAKVEAATLNVGPIQASAVTLPLNRIEFAPGLVKPSGRLRIEQATVGAFNAANEFQGEDIRLGSIDIDLQSKSEANFKMIDVGKLTLPDGPVGAVSASGTVTYGLTSGTLKGVVSSAQGSVIADGKLKFSPFSRKFRATIALAFDKLTGAIATNVLRNLPETQRKALTPPLKGTLTVKTTVARKTPEGETKKRWVATTAITNAMLTGATTWQFDGDLWTQAGTGGTDTPEEGAPGHIPKAPEDEGGTPTP